MHSAQDRIAHLESLLQNMESAPPTHLAHHTHSTSASADFTGLSRKILSVRASPYVSDSAPTLFPARSHAPYPSYDIACAAVQTFFDANALSYPFLDKGEFYRDMDEAYARNERGEQGDDEEWSRKEFVLFMVVAMGTTNRERLGEVERGSSRVFRERAMEGLAAATGKEDIVSCVETTSLGTFPTFMRGCELRPCKLQALLCHSFPNTVARWMPMTSMCKRSQQLCVQALILLGCYAMFDPSGISLWHVVGFAARVAIALNLHRRVDDSSLPQRVVEQRKRVFYSLFNLDRLVAATLSKPLAIADDDIDVEVSRCSMSFCVSYWGASCSADSQDWEKQCRRLPRRELDVQTRHITGALIAAPL